MSTRSRKRGSGSLFEFKWLDLNQLPKYCLGEAIAVNVKVGNGKSFGSGTYNIVIEPEDLPLTGKEPSSTVEEAASAPPLAPKLAWQAEKSSAPTVKPEPFKETVTFSETTLTLQLKNNHRLLDWVTRNEKNLQVKSYQLQFLEELCKALNSTLPMYLCLQTTKGVRAQSAQDVNDMTDLMSNFGMATVNSVTVQMDYANTEDPKVTEYIDAEVGLINEYLSQDKIDRDDMREKRARTIPGMSRTIEANKRGKVKAVKAAKASINLNASLQIEAAGPSLNSENFDQWLETKARGYRTLINSIQKARAQVEKDLDEAFVQTDVGPSPYNLYMAEVFAGFSALTYRCNQGIEEIDIYHVQKLSDVMSSGLALSSPPEEKDRIIIDRDNKAFKKTVEQKSKNIVYDLNSLLQHFKEVCGEPEASDSDMEGILKQMTQVTISTTEGQSGGAKSPSDLAVWAYNNVERDENGNVIYDLLAIYIACKEGYIRKEQIPLDVIDYFKTFLAGGSMKVSNYESIVNIMNGESVDKQDLFNILMGGLSMNEEEMSPLLMTILAKHIQPIVPKATLVAPEGPQVVPQEDEAALGTEASEESEASDVESDEESDDSIKGTPQDPTSTLLSGGTLATFDAGQYAVDTYFDYNGNGGIDQLSMNDLQVICKYLNPYEVGNFASASQGLKDTFEALQSKELEGFNPDEQAVAYLLKHATDVHVIVGWTRVCVYKDLNKPGAGGPERTNRTYLKTQGKFNEDGVVIKSGSGNLILSGLGFNGVIPGSDIPIKDKDTILVAAGNAARDAIAATNYKAMLEHVKILIKKARELSKYGPALYFNFDPQTADVAMSIENVVNTHKEGKTFKILSLFDRQYRAEDTYVKMAKIELSLPTNTGGPTNGNNVHTGLTNSLGNLNQAFQKQDSNGVVQAPQGGKPLAKFVQTPYGRRKVHVIGGTEMVKVNGALKSLKLVQRMRKTIT